jgi:hypothetical protein
MGRSVAQGTAEQRDKGKPAERTTTAVGFGGLRIRRRSKYGGYGSYVRAARVAVDYGSSRSAVPSRWQKVSSTSTRACRLSLPATSVQGAYAVLVRATISSTAAS